MRAKGKEIERRLEAFTENDLLDKYWLFIDSEVSLQDTSIE